VLDVKINVSLYCRNKNDLRHKKNIFLYKEGPAVSIGGDDLTDAMVEKRRVLLAIYNSNIRPQETFRNQACRGRHFTQVHSA
jgi:hypothetical protein